MPSGYSRYSASQFVSKDTAAYSAEESTLASRMSACNRPLKLLPKSPFGIVTLARIWIVSPRIRWSDVRRLGVGDELAIDEVSTPLTTDGIGLPVAYSQS